QKDKLQASFDEIDAKAQRRQLVAAVATAKRGHLETVSSGSGGGSGGSARGTGSVEGMPTSGTLTNRQRMALWVAPGGPKSVGSVAAAVALAESGGRTHAPSKNPAGGSNVGLWQIWSGHGGTSENPLANAKQAVSIWKSAGGTFGRDWE